MCCFKLAQELNIIFREHAEIGHVVFQVCDALNAKSEGIAGVDLAVDATGFENIGVYHTTAEYFHPSSVLAESAAFATADMTRDVHLCTGFGEGEIAWA